MAKKVINQGFIELIKDRVKELKGDYSMTILKDIFKIGKGGDQIMSKNPLYELMKSNIATETTLNKVSAHLNIIFYNNYLDQQKSNEKLAESITGNWTSYRFDSSRRLRISYWSFEYEESFNFFEVVKRSNREVYRGKFYINEDSLFTGKLKHKDTSLHYTSYFAQLDDIKTLSFNLTYNMENETYFSREVMYKANGDLPTKGKVLKGKIKLSASENYIYEGHVNELYEAYNYLSYMSNHNRIDLDEQEWKYKHTIYVSAPVRALNSLGEEKFNFIKEKVDSIITKLTESPFNFDRLNIYNELIHSNYQQKKDEDFVFKYVKDYIDSTHFVAILPPGIGNINTGCYFEIYYRIAKKLPCLVFYDINVEFPHTLKGFVENNGQNNVRFKPINFDELETYFSNLRILDFNIF